MRKTVLLCTVGGSHQPILEAIRATSPAYVCFICSGRDTETERPGSIRQITGSGSVIRARRFAKKPTLPNIPTQAELEPDRFETVVVSTDDLDQGVILIRSAIGKLTERFPGARFVADYTGGTKTMTAALVCAALESEAVELQLVVGARPNLESVVDGTESAMTADVNRLRLDRAMAHHLRAWDRYAYSEALEGLDQIRIIVSSPDRKRLALARALSRTFALWDNFDHAGARGAVQPFGKFFAAKFDWVFPILDNLLGQDRSQRDPARLFDLWLNAERRAAQGRFDDATARVYRLIEWTAQWQLKARLHLDTAAFPSDQLPSSAPHQPASEGHTKIGLDQAWQAVGEKLGGPAQQFALSHRASMRNLLLVRNQSILAHGFAPVGSDKWQRIRTWMHELFLPMLRELAAEAGLHEVPCQLPNRPPELWSSTEASENGTSG